MTRPPPVPKENRSPHEKTSRPPKKDSRPKPHENPDEQGEQGNIRQNTTNQSYQQDR